MRPLDAGQDAGVAAAARVGQHLAGEDLGAERDAVARQGGRPVGAERRADAVRAMPVAVLRLLALDEGPHRYRTADEVRVSGIETRVEHGDPDAPPAEARGRHPDRLQPPGDLVLIEARRRFGGRFRCRRAGEPVIEVDQRVAVAPDVFELHPAGRRLRREEPRRRQAGQHGLADGVHDALGLDGEDRAVARGHEGADLVGRRVHHGHAEILEDEPVRAAQPFRRDALREIGGAGDLHPREVAERPWRPERRSRAGAPGTARSSRAWAWQNRRRRRRRRRRRPRRRDCRDRRPRRNPSSRASCPSVMSPWPPPLVVNEDCARPAGEARPRRGWRDGGRVRTAARPALVLPRRRKVNATASTRMCPRSHHVGRPDGSARVAPRPGVTPPAR